MTGALIFFLYGGYKRFWVWGYQLDECAKERDAWKDLALRNSNLADRSLQIATKDQR